MIKPLISFKSNVYFFTSPLKKKKKTKTDYLQNVFLKQGLDVNYHFWSSVHDMFHFCLFPYF